MHGWRISCCVSIQGLHPSKDPAFEVFEGESFRETLLTASAVVKWDCLAFGAFPGCVTRCFTLTSRFLPPRPAKVTIYATRCRHFLSFFLLFRVRKESWDMWGCIWRSLRIGTAFARRCDIIGLQMLFRRMKTLNWDITFEGLTCFSSLCVMSGVTLCFLCLIVFHAPQLVSPVTSLSSPV